MPAVFPICKKHNCLPVNPDGKDRRFLLIFPRVFKMRSRSSHTSRRFRRKCFEGSAVSVSTLVPFTCLRLELLKSSTVSVSTLAPLTCLCFELLKSGTVSRAPHEANRMLLLGTIATDEISSVGSSTALHSCIERILQGPTTSTTAPYDNNLGHMRNSKLVKSSKSRLPSAPRKLRVGNLISRNFLWLKR